MNLHNRKCIVTFFSIKQIRIIHITSTYPPKIPHCYSTRLFFCKLRKTFTSSTIAQEKVKVCAFHEALTNLLVKVLLSFIVTTFCAQIGSESNVLWVPAFLEINEMDRTTRSVLMSSSSMQQGGFYTLTSSIRRWIHFGTLILQSVINQLNQLAPNI